MRVLMSFVVSAALVLLSCGGGNGGEVDPSATSPSLPTSDTASASTPPSQPVPGSVTLRGDGLGVVFFGQDADEVMRVLEASIGSPPTDPGSEADWVEFVGWGDLGLFVGFDTPAADGYTGVSRFVGWEYVGSDGSPGFVTTEGAGIGTTLPELRARYGDGLEVSTAIDECVSGTAYPIVLSGSIYGAIDRAPADDALVSILWAGVGVGC